MLVSAETEHPRLNNCEIISEEFQSMSINVTDRQTDRRTDGQTSDPKTAVYCSASRGKNEAF